MKKYFSQDFGSRGEAINSRAPVFAPKGRHQGVSHGGVPVIANMLDGLGFAEAVNGALPILKVRRGYAESDHVLNIALNALCDGRTLDDIDLRRNDKAFLKALGARSLPDPTTAGDFCRRFDENTILKLQEAVNGIRGHVWRQQSEGC